MLKVSTYKGGFAEIYWGESGLRYSLLKSTPDGFEAMHGNTCCKDFFTDTFYAETLKKPTSIHGFKWAPGTFPATQKTFHMCIEFEKKDLSGKVKTAQALLNAWEERFGIKPSKVQVDSTGKRLVFSFDKEWTVRPVMISFFTLLLRLAPMYTEKMGPTGIFHEVIKNGNPYGEYDKGELGKRGVIDAIEECWDTHTPPSPSQTYEQYDTASGAHHRGGFIAHTTGMATG